MFRIPKLTGWTMAAALLGGGVIPAMAQAQFRAGGNIGMVFDSPSDFALLGIEGRGTLSSIPIDIAPRLTFNPTNGGSTIQLDLNALYNLPLKMTDMFVPYVGTGIAFLHTPGYSYSYSITQGNTTTTYSASTGGNTSVGYNLVWGTVMNFKSSPLQPYIQFQYSVILSQQNLAEGVVGVMYNFGFGKK